MTFFTVCALIVIAGENRRYVARIQIPDQHFVMGGGNGAAPAVLLPLGVISEVICEWPGAICE